MLVRAEREEDECDEGREATGLSPFLRSSSRLDPLRTFDVVANKLTDAWTQFREHQDRNKKTTADQPPTPQTRRPRKRFQLRYAAKEAELSALLLWT